MKNRYFLSLFFIFKMKLVMALKLNEYFSLFKVRMYFISTNVLNEG